MHRWSTAPCLAALVTLAFAFDGAGQDACPSGRIAEVVVENQSIFDPASIPDDDRIAWAYRLANAVHVPTREDFIAGALLFEIGDCYDPARARESARILREFRFIARAEVSTPDADSLGRRIVVRTQDEWSTKLALSVAVDEGVQFRGASLFEENLLGRGITLGIYAVDREARRDMGGIVEIPAFRGSEFDALLGASRSRGGGSAHVEFVRPVRGELPGMALRQRFSYNRELFSFVLPEGSEYSHLTIPDLLQQIEISAARRIGSPGNLYVLGGGASYERVRLGGGTGVEAVRDRDFSNPVPLVGLLTESIEPQMADRRVFRANLLLGVRRLSFETRRGLDSVTGIQDLPVGWEVTGSIGRSLGGTVRGGPDDLFVRGGLVFGTSDPSAVTQLRFTAEGRRDDAAPSGSAYWKDILTEGHAFLYLTPGGPLTPTWVLRGAVHGGWSTTAPFQLTLGGPEGVRGYTDEDFPGGRRAVVSAEGRFGGPRLFPNLLDLGLTLFGDVGATWAGDAPFGSDSGWRGSLGAGVRVGFPAGTSSVIRIDLAYPLGPGAGARSPILRISAREWIGVIHEPRSAQLDRSRRSGIRSDFTGAARDGAIP